MTANRLSDPTVAEILRSLGTAGLAPWGSPGRPLGNPASQTNRSFSESASPLTVSETDVPRTTFGGSTFVTLGINTSGCPAGSSLPPRFQKRAVERSRTPGPLS